MAIYRQLHRYTKYALSPPAVRSLDVSQRVQCFLRNRVKASNEPMVSCSQLFQDWDGSTFFHLAKCKQTPEPDDLTSVIHILEHNVMRLFAVRVGECLSSIASNLWMFGLIADRSLQRTNCTGGHDQLHGIGGRSTIKWPLSIAEG